MSAGLECTDRWEIRPLHIDEAYSSFFDNPVQFPAGTTTLDRGFLMEGLATNWQPQPKLLA